jgi:DNA-binding MarR family transcriptional regulator
MSLEHSRKDSDRSAADRITKHLTAICTSLRAKAWKAATAEGLTPTQCHILIMLGEGMVKPQPTAIAAALAITRPSVGQAIDALVRKGLVAREVVQTSRRDIALTLTIKGQEVAVLVGRYSDLLTLAVEGLLPDDKRAYFRSSIRSLLVFQQGSCSLEASTSAAHSASDEAHLFPSTRPRARLMVPNHTILVPPSRAQLGHRWASFLPALRDQVVVEPRMLCGISLGADA